MSSISSINSTQSAAVSTYKTQEELSSSTKMKLESLGIDPTTVTSEAQAQTLIAQAEATKNQQNAGQQGGGNSSEQELLSEAKSLASTVGVTVSSNDTLDDIIDNISAQLQVMMNSGDQSKISQAQSLQTQLASISDRADSIQSTQQNIFNAMNMVSISNKYALGL